MSFKLNEVLYSLTYIFKIVQNFIKSEYKHFVLLAVLTVAVLCVCLKRHPIILI